MIKPFGKIAGRPPKIKQPLLTPEELQRKEEESLRREEEESRLDSIKEVFFNNLKNICREAFSSYPFKLPKERKISWSTTGIKDIAQAEVDYGNESFFASYTHPTEIILSIETHLPISTPSEIPEKEIEMRVKDLLKETFNKYRVFSESSKHDQPNKPKLQEKVEDFFTDKIDSESYAYDENGEEVEGVEHPDFIFESLKFNSEGLQIDSVVIEPQKIYFKIKMPWRVFAGNLIVNRIGGY